MLWKRRFAAAPVLAGLDKFFHIDWNKYLAPSIANLLPVAPHAFMQVVGVVEIAAGIVVAFWPMFGGYLVGLWLLGIIGNLLIMPGYLDVALRDFGLALGAFALARLASDYRRA